MIILNGSSLVLTIQGSKGWIELRKNFITATEIAMITNRDCWETFEKQKNSPSNFQSKAMKRGNALEPKARECLSRKTGLQYFPAVFVNKQEGLLASLDGLAIQRKATCEIKCPEKGVDSDLWKEALKNKMPSRYWKQIQQGLLLSGAPVCHYWVYDEITDTGIKIDVFPDDNYQREILKAAREYWNKKKSGEVIGVEDVVSITDDQALSLGAKYEEVAKECSDLEKYKKRLEERIKELAGVDSDRVIIGNLQIDVKETKGSIDYKKIVTDCMPHLDIEAYRKEPANKERVTIKVLNNKGNTSNGNCENNEIRQSA